MTKETNTNKCVCVKSEDEFTKFNHSDSSGSFSFPVECAKRYGIEYKIDQFSFWLNWRRSDQHHSSYQMRSVLMPHRFLWAKVSFAENWNQQVACCSEPPSPFFFNRHTMLLLLLVLVLLPLLLLFLTRIISFHLVGGLNVDDWKPFFSSRKCVNWIVNEQFSWIDVQHSSTRV